MVLDSDREPKAAIAQLARALSSAEDLTPSTVTTSAELISSEIKNFIDLHPAYRTLHVHALRPGDGLAVVRGLKARYGRARRGVTKQTCVRAGALSFQRASSGGRSISFSGE